MGPEINRPIIKNRDILLNPLLENDIISIRKVVLDILEAGVLAADPQDAVMRAISCNEDMIILPDGLKKKFSEIDRIFVIGVGKASAAMANALETLLGEKISNGYINIPENQNLELFDLKKVKVNPAGHPLVNKGSIEGTKKIIGLLKDLTTSDLIFCLLSGGGSALLELPADGITLDDLNLLFKELSRVGATIHELNTLRKHLSKVKGGRLAQAAQPAMVVSLIISDVVGDDLDTIASGPTAPDRSTWLDTKKIIEKYNLSETIPSSIMKIIDEGINGIIDDTPKFNNLVFRNVKNIIIASNKLSCNAMKEYAEGIGLQSTIVTTSLCGEAKTIGKDLVKDIREQQNKTALIMGGETTVTIKGKGKGGRSQELVLASCEMIGDEKGLAIAAIGSDGIDGPTDVAGAIVDNYVSQQGQKLGLKISKYLENNDSYNYLKETKSHIITELTGTNVMDLIVAVKMSSKM